MIINGKNPNMAKAVERNKKINHLANTNSFVPCCGHDFWETAKTLDYGDVIMCNRCHVYYAKIKHLPWLVEEKGYGTYRSREAKGYHTNHLGGAWFVPVPARVTD